MFVFRPVLTVLSTVSFMLAGSALPADATGTTYATFTGHVASDGRSGDTANNGQLGEIGARCDEAFVTSSYRGIASTCYVSWVWDPDDPYSICTASVDNGWAYGYYHSQYQSVGIEFLMWGAGAPGEGLMVGYIPNGVGVYEITIDASDFCAALNLAGGLVAAREVPSNFNGTVKRLAV